MDGNSGALRKESKAPDRTDSGATSLPEADLREIQHLLGHLSSDDVANIVLKGHLVIEESVTEALEINASRPEYLEGARLTFAQKLCVCRSASPTLSDGPIWEVVSKLNSLRNALSHSLDGERRTKATENLLITYSSVCGGKIPPGERASESLLFTCILAMCIGFLTSVKREIGQIKMKSS